MANSHNSPNQHITFSLVAPLYQQLKLAPTHQLRDFILYCSNQSVHQSTNQSVNQENTLTLILNPKRIRILGSTSPFYLVLFLTNYMMYVSKLNNFNLNISFVKGVTFVSGMFFSEVLITMEKNVIFYITFILLLLFYCIWCFTVTAIIVAKACHLCKNHNLNFFKIFLKMTASAINQFALLKKRYILQ